MLTDILISALPALICITLHELSHGFAAWLLGDDTAKKQGRLTLNPIKHIDVMGLLMMVVFKFGWAKPVPVNMNKFKKPKVGMAVTALAGPVSNLLIACVFLFLYGILYLPLMGNGAGEIALQILYTTAYISTALAVFNFLPIPPLDGSKVLFSFISDRAYYGLMRYERYGMIALVLLVGTGLLRKPLGICTTFLMDRLFQIAEFAFGIAKNFV